MSVLRRTVALLVIALPAHAMSFGEAVDVVMGFEGGHNTSDPSRYGITQETLDRASVGPDRVGDLTRNQARRIYRDLYWDRIRGDSLHDGVDLAVFDMAVQHGPVTAIEVLQEVLGVARDGKIGPRTLDAIDGCRCIDDLHAKRALIYADTQRLSDYGYGWYRRLFRVHDLALQACRDPAP